VSSTRPASFGTTVVFVTGSARDTGNRGLDVACRQNPDRADDSTCGFGRLLPENPGRHGPGPCVLGGEGADHAQ
jgi:hypothetical protein